MDIVVKLKPQGVWAVELKASPRTHLQVEGDGPRAEIEQWIESYLSGKPLPLPPLLLPTLSPFTRQALHHLLTIPFGHVQTYGEVAAALGMKGAARAVGGACHRNPIPLFIPCHRVVGHRDLGGFGLGLSVKRELLKLEGIV